MGKGFQGSNERKGKSIFFSKCSPDAIGKALMGVAHTLRAGCECSHSRD